MPTFRSLNVPPAVIDVEVVLFIGSRYCEMPVPFSRETELPHLSKPTPVLEREKSVTERRNASASAGPSGSTEVYSFPGAVCCDGRSAMNR